MCRQRQQLHQCRQRAASFRPIGSQLAPNAAAATESAASKRANERPNNAGTSGTLPICITSDILSASICSINLLKMIRSQCSLRSTVNEDTTSSGPSLSDILKRLTLGSLSKQHYLSSLNELSRLCRQKKREDLLRSLDATNIPFTLDDVFRSLKAALFHEAAEVRAATLRAIRYLLKDEIAVKSLLRANMPIFIVRSIDIVLENRTERIQALRLVRKFLSISPHLFPSAFTRSLIAIAQDGQFEHDTLTRACWALLAELSIMSPISSTKHTQNCAFNAIMDAALAGNQPHGMCESLISTLLYMLNWPKYRRLIRGDLDLQIFVAPFTDSHYTAPVSKDQKQRINQTAKFDVDPYDQRENKFTAAKITLISILRSWQGLIYLCEPQSSECNLVSNSCLKSLINMLYLPYNDVRRRLIDLIFELLYLPLPDSLTDFETGLKFLEKNQLSMDSWKIHDAFVVDEAKALLQPLRTRPRMNLVNNYLALLLITLFHCNVVDALSEVIITPSNQENSIRATILLYQLLSLSYQYLPTDSFSQYLTLSTLISHATSKIDDSRDLANAALINLGRVHPLKKSSHFTDTRCSLFLGKILEFCSPSSITSSGFLIGNKTKSITSCGMSTTSTVASISTVISNSATSTSSSTSTLVGNNNNSSAKASRSPSISSRTNSILSRSSSVSSATSHLLTLFSFPSNTKSNLKTIIDQDWHLWDWEHINFLLTRPSDTMKRMSSQHHRAFVKRLVHFFKPSSNQYSLIGIDNERCRQLCETGCNLVDFLVASPEPKATELLRELLHDISISMHDPESGNNHTNSYMNTSSNNNSHSLNSPYNSTSGSSHLTGSGGALRHLSPHSDVNILSSSKLITTMSSTYFLFIGRLSNTLRGFQMLEKSTIMKLINNLTQTSMLATSPAEVYVRLIISCFDYTKEFNGSRQLLEKFLFHHPEENVRIYATNFLRVLLRANIPDFSSWAIELLVRQLDSPLRVVHNAAADILDEACDLDENLEGLIELEQVVDSKDQTKNVIDILRSSGDAGVLLLSRYASCPNGLQYLVETPREHLSCPLDSVLSPSPSTDFKRNSNEKPVDEVDHHHHHQLKLERQAIESIIDNSKAETTRELPKQPLLKVESEFDYELNRWRRVFNHRYVKLVEDVLNNSLTYHQKGEDGKYGRRIDRINPMTKNSNLPVHLYGQLASHPEGVELIQSKQLMKPVYEMLRDPPNDLNYSEVSVLKFKTALWIVGSVASSESGYQLLDNSREIVKLITEIARTAAVLSLRGTAFYVLGLLGLTAEGAEEMKEYNWIVQSYSAVALPLDLSSILTKPIDEFDSSTCSLEEQPLADELLESSPLSHNENNHNHFGPKANLNSSLGQVSIDSSSSNDISSLDTLPNLASQNSVLELNSELRKYPKSELDQTRRDVLRLVTQLSHSVASRPAENSLLNLKRKYGLIFKHDLGLYAEVCQQLAKYNFRLHARRFLQELFLDIT